MNLQDVIHKVWPDVRKRHLFPELPTPEIVESEEEAVSIQMKGKTIQIDQETLEALAKAMPIETGLKGVVTPIHPGALKFWQEKDLTLPGVSE